jgi:cell wall assembly regulator SMI1
MLIDLETLERAVRETAARTDGAGAAGAKPGSNMRRRRLNAIRKAFRHLAENPYIHYEAGRLLLLSDSKTDRGEAKFYETSRTQCRLIDPADELCHAFWAGFPCWHRAALELVECCFEILGRPSEEVQIDEVKEQPEMKAGR